MIIKCNSQKYRDVKFYVSTSIEMNCTDLLLTRSQIKSFAQKKILVSCRSRRFRSSLNPQLLTADCSVSQSERVLLDSLSDFPAVDKDLRLVSNLQLLGVYFLIFHGRNPDCNRLRCFENLKTSIRVKSTIAF